MAQCDVASLLKLFLFRGHQGPVRFPLRVFPQYPFAHNPAYPQIERAHEDGEAHDNCATRAAAPLGKRVTLGDRAVDWRLGQARAPEETFSWRSQATTVSTSAACVVATSASIHSPLVDSSAATCTLLAVSVNIHRWMPTICPFLAPSSASPTGR